jgi:hypothetical protein
MSEPTADQLRAKVFEDRETPGDWRVEKLNADGEIIDPPFVLSSRAEPGNQHRRIFNVSTMPSCRAASILAWPSLHVTSGCSRLTRCHPAGG